MSRGGLPGPETVASAVLANGLTVFVYENPTSPTVVIDANLPGGAMTESKDKAGLANLSASLLRRGTMARSFDAVNAAVEAVGASFSFSSGRHVTSFDAKCLPEDTDLVLELLAESLAEPAFDEGQFAQLKTQVLTGIRERKHSPRAVAGLAFREMLFGDHPYGRSLAGEEETVSVLERDDVAAFHRQQVRPAGGMVVLAGALAAEDAIARLERTLGRWQPIDGAPPIEVPPVTFPAETVTRTIPIPGKSQSDIILGWPGIPRRHPDYFPVVLCNAILGQFGLGGRLGANVREKQGMAYSASSSVETNSAFGSWYAAAGVNPANIDATLAAIRHEVAHITQELVSEDELADVQANLTGSLPLRLETNAGIAGYLLDMAWHGLGLDYLLSYADRVRAVTREDVLRVAQTYLHPDRYVLAVAGPER